MIDSSDLAYSIGLVTEATRMDWQTALKAAQAVGNRDIIDGVNERKDEIWPETYECSKYIRV